MSQSSNPNRYWSFSSTIVELILIEKLISVRQTLSFARKITAENENDRSLNSIDRDARENLPMHSMLSLQKNHQVDEEVNALDQNHSLSILLLTMKAEVEERHKVVVMVLDRDHDWMSLG